MSKTVTIFEALAVMSTCILLGFLIGSELMKYYAKKSIHKLRLDLLEFLDEEMKDINSKKFSKPKDAHIFTASSPEEAIDLIKNISKIAREQFLKEELKSMSVKFNDDDSIEILEELYNIHREL